VKTGSEILDIYSLLTIAGHMCRLLHSVATRTSVLINYVDELVLLCHDHVLITDSN